MRTSNEHNMCISKKTTSASSNQHQEADGMQPREDLDHEALHKNRFNGDASTWIDLPAKGPQNVFLLMFGWVSQTKNNLAPQGVPTSFSIAS